MALVQKDLFNSPYAGVFCATNDNLTLVPPGIPKDDMAELSEALGTKLEIITLGGSRVLGTLIAISTEHALLIFHHFFLILEQDHLLQLFPFF